MQHDARLTLIEEKLAHLEKYVGDLDEVVRDLAARLSAQRDGVVAVRKLLEDHLSAPGSETISDQDLADEKPPHW